MYFYSSDLSCGHGEFQVLRISVNACLCQFSQVGVNGVITGANPFDFRQRVCLQRNNEVFLIGTYEMRFRLGHSSYQTQQKPIVEKSGMIEAVLIADQDVRHAKQIKQAIRFFRD